MKDLHFFGVLEVFFGINSLENFHGYVLGYCTVAHHYWVLIYLCFLILFWVAMFANLLLGTTSSLLKCSTEWNYSTLWFCESLVTNLLTCFDSTHSVWCQHCTHDALQSYAVCGGPQISFLFLE